MKFIDHAVDRGIKMLRDDQVFVAKMIFPLELEQKRIVLKRYIDIWCDAMAQCEIASQKQNEGRRKANLFMLGLYNDKRQGPRKT